MEFIDRCAELDRLDRWAARGQPGLAVIWGRRRVGKTRLLLEWNLRHRGLYWVADLSAAAVQRRYLAGSIESVVPGFAEADYPDWRSLLGALARGAVASGWTGPLILDELPYLVESSPELPSVLQAWLDHEARQAGLLVVVAGSSQHMMQGLTLDASSPLFGRAAEAFCLSPLPAGHIQQALDIADAKECVQALAAWGGIPRYWELASPFGSDLDVAVDTLMLDPLGPLHREPDLLLAAERPSALSLRPLLDVIGGGVHRLSEIGGRLGQPATSLGRPLRRLIELGLVHREIPFGDPPRGGKRALYRIADPFVRSWFRVVAPNRGLLAQTSTEARQQIWQRAFPGLVSETWEALCRAAVPRLACGGALAELGPWCPAARYWRGSGPEWDVVARSVDGECLLLGEVKWHVGEVDSRFLDATAHALVARGVPVAAGRPQRIVHAVFVPRRAQSARGHPVSVIEDSDVLAALL